MSSDLEKFNWPMEMYNELIDSYTKKVDSEIIKDITEILKSNKKLVHYTGSLESYMCSACGKPKLSNTTDLWVVLKSTWENKDPYFIKCVDLKPTIWNLKLTSLYFVNTPTICNTISYADLRTNLLLAITKEKHGLAIDLIDLLRSFESTFFNNAAGRLEFYEKLKQVIKLRLKYGSNFYLRNLLRMAYISAAPY